MSQFKPFMGAAGIVFSLALLASSPARGEERTPRKGLLFSLIGFVGSEVAETQDVSIGGGGRLGGGITEDLLLYAEARSSLIPRSALDSLIFLDTQLKGQYYPWQDFYVNLGFGVATMLSTFGALTLDPFDTGFSMSAGAGYEFRHWKRFFIAPEFRFGYKRISGANFVTPEVGGQLGWHF